MQSPATRYALLAVRALLTAAFLAAGAAKLAGAEMMVATFDAVGFGQWFRYFTGAAEVAGAIGLWVPQLRQAAASGLLLTMACATIGHLTVIPGSPVPALVLGALLVLLLVTTRAQPAPSRA
jgi:putative oxidoreductase